MADNAVIVFDSAPVYWSVEILNAGGMCLVSASYYSVVPNDTVEWSSTILDCTVPSHHRLMRTVSVWSRLSNGCSRKAKLFATIGRCIQRPSRIWIEQWKLSIRKPIIKKWTAKLGIRASVQTQNNNQSGILNNKRERERERERDVLSGGH